MTHGKFVYVCGRKTGQMETQVKEEKDTNYKLYWLITLVSLVACVTLLFLAPEWFWLTLPFLFTYFVKAIGMM